VSWFSSAWHDVTDPGQLISDGKHFLGQVTDEGAHLAGRGLTDVGLGQLGNTVDGWGDDAAEALDPEMQLGQTDNPTDLIHGDPAAIRSTATQLGQFSDAFGQTAAGLNGIDTSHWTGAAADAFRAKYAPQPPKWQDASTASGSAGNALGSYGDTVEWAQRQAKEAIAMYAEGQKASASARTAYNDQVAAYNAQAQTYDTLLAAGQNPGPRPVEPGPFTDPGVPLQEHAQVILSDARAARDAAGSQAAAQVSKATESAPASPSVWSQVGDTLTDASQQEQLANTSFDAGVINGVANMGKFARDLNPYDPWNMEHPNEYLAGLSGIGAGLVHDAVHPNDLVGQVLGSGWGSDPAEALGNLVPQALLAVASDGAGAAGDAAADGAVGVGEAAGDAGDAAGNAAAGGPPDLSNYGPQGVKAQQILDQYGTKVRYTTKGGSYYDSSTNTVTIDTTNGDPGVGLIHEANHVAYDQAGAHANPATLSRNDYIDQNLHEETDGTVAQIQGNQALQAGNPGAPATAAQAQYEAGYQSGVQQAAQTAAQQGRTLTPAEATAAGQQGGWQAVNNWFRSPSAQASTSGETYTQLYGRYWDEYQAWQQGQAGTNP